MKKKVLLICTLISAISAMAQENTNLLNHELTITVGANSTSFENKNITEDKYKFTDKKQGINIGLAYTKYYNDRIGISVGLNYSTYAQDVYQKGYFEEVGKIDLEGHYYTELLIADVTENYSISFLEVPLMLKVILGNPKNVHLFIEGGIVYGKFMKKHYKKDGWNTNQGRYPTGWDHFYTLAHDNPYYGYGTRSYNEGPKDIYGSNNLSGRLTVGLSSAVSNNIRLIMAPTYTFGVKDILNSEAKKEGYVNVFNKKSDKDYSSTKISAIGINFGISFKL